MTMLSVHLLRRVGCDCCILVAILFPSFLATCCGWGASGWLALAFAQENQRHCSQDRHDSGNQLQPVYHESSDENTQRKHQSQKEILLPSRPIESCMVEFL